MKFYSSTIPATNFKESGVKIGSRKFGFYKIKLEETDIHECDSNSPNPNIEFSKECWVHFGYLLNLNVWGFFLGETAPIPSND